MNFLGEDTLGSTVEIYFSVCLVHHAGWHPNERRREMAGEQQVPWQKGQADWQQVQ